MNKKNIFRCVIIIIVLLICVFSYNYRYFLYTQRKSVVEYTATIFEDRTDEFQQMASFLLRNPRIYLIDNDLIVYYPSNKTDGPPHVYNKEEGGRLTIEATGEQKNYDFESLTQDLQITHQELNNFYSLMKKCQVFNVIHSNFYNDERITFFIKHSPFFALNSYVTIVYTPKDIQLTLKNYDVYHKEKCIPLNKKGWYILDNL